MRNNQANAPKTTSSLHLFVAVKFNVLNFNETLFLISPRAALTSQLPNKQKANQSKSQEPPSLANSNKKPAANSNPQKNAKARGLMVRQIKNCNRHEETNQKRADATNRSPRVTSTGKIKKSRPLQSGRTQAGRQPRQEQAEFFFALQARATSDRSRQLRRQDKAIQYSVHKEAY